jgi:hypothetical protein
MFDVPGTEIAECPVSYIGAEARQIVEIFFRGKLIHGNCGAQMFGPDQSQWPVWAADAVAIIEQESIREHNARMEYEQSRRP